MEDTHMEKLAQIEKKIREAERLQIKAESRKQALTEQLNTTIEEIKGLGVDPNNLENLIKNLELEIEQDMSEIEKALPLELLNQIA